MSQRRRSTRPGRGAGSRHRTPERRLPRAAQRTAWLGVLTAGLALFALVRQAWLTTGNPNLLPSLLLLGATVTPAAAVAFVLGRGWRVELGPVTILAIAFVGGIVGVTASGLLEYVTLRELGALPAAGVAFIEETAKLLGPAVALTVTRRSGWANGFVAGVAAGAGFAVMETLGYSVVALVGARDLSVVDELLLHRGLFSPATHPLWTGLVSAAIGTAMATRWTPRAVLLLAVSFAVAFTLHAIWDTRSGDAAYAVLAIVGLAGAMLQLRACRAATSGPTPLTCGTVEVSGRLSAPSEPVELHRGSALGASTATFTSLPVTRGFDDCHRRSQPNDSPVKARPRHAATDRLNCKGIAAPDHVGALAQRSAHVRPARPPPRARGCSRPAVEGRPCRLRTKAARVGHTSTVRRVPPATISEALPGSI